MSSGAGVRRSGGLPVVALAVAATVLGMLPVYLLGGLAVQIGEELGLTEAGLGLAVSTFFTTSALVSVPGGRLSQRIGAERGILLGAVSSLLALLGVAAIVTSLPTLLVVMAVGGLGSGLSQPAANLALARQVPAQRQGLAFGAKQSSVPVTTLLGGLAVPVIALTVGWRWAYVAGAGLAVVLTVWAVRRDSNARPAPVSPATIDRRQVRSLVPLAIAGGLASGAVNALGAFLVLWGVRSGLSASASGLMFASGSAVSIVTMVSFGGLVDRRRISAVRTAGGFLLLGSAGMGLLATGSVPAVFFVGTLLAFGAGWAWPGLFNLAIVRRHADAPAAATGITQTGVFAGAVVGPVAFGVIAQAWSYAAGWWLVAVALALAGALIIRSSNAPGDAADRPPA